MLKLRFVLLAALCMTLASVFATSAKSVKPLPTKCGPYCDRTGGSTTPTATAIGASCPVAQTNLTSQLQAYANSFCGARGCNLVVHTPVACHPATGGYSVSGYATFGCLDSNC